MKKIIYLSLLFSFHSWMLMAQSISRDVTPTSGGTYTNGTGSLSWTLGETITPTLQVGSNILTQGFQQPESDLTTGTVATFVCAGDVFDVSYTAFDIFAGNTFTAQLSDASGSFAAPVVIGSLVSSVSGIISVTIPPATIPGNGYRIRVVSSMPVLIGTDNGTDITIGGQPAISCPADITVNNDAGVCGAIVNFTATGSGSPAPVITYSQDPGTLFPIGNTVVTATSTNDCGVVTCTFTVTVIDAEAPVITCNGPITFNNDPGICGATFVVPPPTYSDNCTSLNNALMFDGSNDKVVGNNANLPQGSAARTIEAWVYRRSNAVQTIFSYGNFANNQRSGLLILSGHLYYVGELNDFYSSAAPVPINQWTHVAVTLNGTALQFYINGVLVQSGNLNSVPNTTGSVFALSNTSGYNPPREVFNGAIDELRVWNVVRTPSEILSNISHEFYNPMPANLVAYHKLNSGVVNANNTGVNSSIDETGNGNGTLVNFALNGINSNWTTGYSGLNSPNLTSSFLNPITGNAFFPIGTTPVVWTVTDAAGNSASCTQNVTVVDNELPSISCVGNISVNNDPGICGAVVTYAAPVADDNCTFTVMQTAGLASGATYPIGTTINTFVVTDSSGNSATCSFSVTVTDNELPTISNVPANITACNPVTWTPPTITDNCPGVQVVASHVPGSVFPSGTTTVTYTATDVYNQQTSASFTVTVLEPSVAATDITSNRDYNNICIGENITLTLNGGSLGQGASWNWYSGTCGGASAGTGTSITVLPTSTTTYFARAEGTCNITACVQITVVVSTGSPSGSPVYSQVPSFGAPGITDTIKVNPVPGATYYYWFTNNGQINGVLFNGGISPQQTAIPEVAITFVLPQQNYQIRVRAGNACGRTGQSNTHIRGTVVAPTSITGPTLVCPGQTFSYTVSAVPPVSGNGPVSYNWYLVPSSAGTISGNGLTRNVTFAAGFTSAQLCVTAQGSNGLASVPYCISISSNAPIPGSISGNVLPCQGSNGTYTISGVTGATSYSWSTNIAGATVSGTGTSGSATFPNNVFSGNICVSSVSACGTSTPSCLVVSSGAPGIPGPITGPVLGICGASNVNYSLATNDANNYTWILPSGATINGAGNSNSVNVDFSNGFAGGTIEVTAHYDCGTASSSIVVSGEPIAPTVTPATICAGTTELYFASSTGAASYSWSVTGANSNFCTNPPSCSQQYIEWGPIGGTFSVTATNTCGTSTPFNLSTNCRISDDGSLETKVYPNPTTGMITVEINSYAGGNHNLIVTDLSGRMVLDKDITTTSGRNQLELDLGFVNKGMYMLYIKSVDGKISVTKIAVE